VTTKVIPKSENPATAGSEYQKTPLENRKSNANLDTLADLRKVVFSKYLKRAKSKYITNSYILPLVDLNSPLKKSYWNTFHCSETLLQVGGKVTAKYCNNRWCLVCNRIRTAKMINQYMDQMQTLNDLHFVTLTIPNVDQRKLRQTIEKMQKDFRRILDKYRRRKQPMDGLRKLECTFSKLRGDFHPHFHVVISGRNEAINLLNDWIERNPKARLQAQDIKMANEASLIELFKYFTKVVTKTGSESNDEYAVNIKALDQMNQAFYRKRVFQGFGCVKSKSEEVEKLQADDLGVQFDGGVFEWVQDVSDWVSEYGEMMTNNDHYKQVKVKTT